MIKTKYISPEQLKRNLSAVIEEICKHKTEYILMINNEPKVRLSALNDKDGKKIVIAKGIEDEKLKKFVE